MIKYILTLKLQTLNLTMKFKRSDDFLVSHLGEFSVKTGLAAPGNVSQLSSCSVFQITMDQEILPETDKNIKHKKVFFLYLSWLDKVQTVKSA